MKLEIKNMIYTFEIEPVPYLRMTQGQIKLMHVPDHKLNKGQLRAKQRIVRYMNYKNSLVWLAKKEKFKLPDVFGITFYIHTDKKIETPPSILAAAGTGMCLPHQNKPDLDNLLKAFKDALSIKDQTVYHYRGVAKYWTNEKSTIVVTI